MNGRVGALGLGYGGAHKIVPNRDSQFLNLRDLEEFMAARALTGTSYHYERWLQTGRSSRFTLRARLLGLKERGDEFRRELDESG